MGSVQDKARRLSKACYNNGLELAGVRDLSGAMRVLRISVQLDKTNIDARNLLGLVYYETGEIISALREWVISQNLQPVQNPAAIYLADIQKDQQHLRQMNQVIRLYNEALQQCREGHDDIAAVGLRRAVSRNPKYVNAMLLLTLIELKNGRYSQARRYIQRIQKIDKANPRALVYAKEIQEYLDTRNHSSGRKSRRRADNADPAFDPDLTSVHKNDNFREKPSYMGMFNVFFGLLIGILAVLFLIVPAVRRSVSRDANEKLVEYTTTIATQDSKINELENQIEQSNTTVSDAQDTIAAAQEKADSFDDLIQAYIRYQRLEYTSAYELLQNVNKDLLSTEAVELYDSIASECAENAYSYYVYSGNEALYLENYEDAVTAFENALEIESDDYDVMTSLASAYTYLNNYDRAREIYQTIIDENPDTRRAEYTQALIEQLGQSTAGSADEDADTGNADMEENSDDTDTSGEQVTEEFTEGDATGGMEEQSVAE